MLPIIRSFLGLLETEGIDYVFWKSLENLPLQLQGNDDLDILVRSTQREKVLAVCKKGGLFLNSLSKDRTADRIYKHYGFDFSSGKFVQFHIHFICCFGSKEFKEFRFPLEEQMLATYSIDHGVRVLSKEMFFITRILHAIVKKNDRDLVARRLLAEFENTDDLFDRHKIISLFQQALPQIDASVVLPKLVKEWSMAERHPLIEDSLRISSISALKNEVGKYRGLKFTMYHSRLFKKLFGKNKIEKRLSVSIAGADGSGKSSTAREVSVLLGAIAKTKVIYLGRQHWTLFNRAVSWCSLKLPPLRLWKLLWCVTSSAEIYGRYLYGQVLKFFGVIVIYDRDLVDLEIKWKGHLLFPAIAAMNQILHGRWGHKHILLRASTRLAEKRAGNLAFEDVRRRQESYESWRKMAEVCTLDVDSIRIAEVARKVVIQMLYGNGENEKRSSYEGQQAQATETIF